MQMQDRVAVVTGGASGIGRGISLVLAERGADVALIDIDMDGARNTEREIAGLGRKAATYRANVASAAEVEEAVDAILSEFGRIDVLVNAAGVIGAPGWEDSPASREVDWDITFDVNVKGTVIASDVVSRHMKARKSGKIVNIASHGGRRGGANVSAYGASKAAVIHLTQSYALELAQYDLNVNAVCPGTLWTPMWERIAERTRRIDPVKSHMTTREIFDEAIRERCPLGREQTPEDIGKAVAFFASDDAYNITGQSLNVNGGTRTD